MRLSQISTGAGLLLALANATFADTVSLLPPKDNTLYEDSTGQLSDGQGIYFYVGKTGSNAGFKLRRAVIGFDLSSIPANSTVTGATLTLFESRSSPNSSTTNVALHKMLRDWGEGASNSGLPGGSGAVAQSGDATWIYNFYNTSSWSVPGGDFSSVVSASSAITTDGRAYTWSGSGLIADLQAWVNSPATNFGWAITGDEANSDTAVRFNSGENSASPPVLSVTYQPPAATPTPTPTPTPVPTATPFDPTNPIPAVIPHGPLQVDVKLVASGLAAPDLLVSAPDGTNRQFVLDQTGQIRIIKNGTLLPTPFLDVSSLLVPFRKNSSGAVTYDERGLLGLAFDPGFANPQSPGYRRLFTYTSQPVSGTADLIDQYATTHDSQGVIASWRVDAANPDVVDPTTRREILRIDKPQFNHNGGEIRFGPDGYLYFGIGDGGGANDNGVSNDSAGHNPTIGNAQDTSIGLGKILRIDVNGTNAANGKYGIPSDNPFAAGGGIKEIFAYGLRNPYRFSFDKTDLIVADVGQNSIEEIDRVQIGKNYGWRYKEGTFKFKLDGTVSNDLTGIPAGLVDPIAQYDHDEGISIIGGFVYRGSAMPELQGKYIFGDFSKSFSTPSGRLFYVDLTSGEIRALILGRDDRALGLFVKGMGQDQNGEIYVLGSTTLAPSGTTGVVYQLVPVQSQLRNISTRLRVGTGDNVMIGGFIVTGTTPKKVIIRAMGPSLQQSGLTDVLADPTLELHAADNSLITSNDNWKDSQQTEIQNSGIPPTNDLESAIVTTLQPGNYTAIEKGKNQTSGVGLVEVYELDQNPGSQLANISTRGFVQPGNNVMIGGFILGGGSLGANAKIVARGIGPSLSQSSVPNALPDPTLELHDVNGALLFSNDNWKDDSVQAAAISSSGLAPKDDRESAIVATLPPGAYTAIIAGKSGVTGIALVEVYRLP